MDEAIHKLSGVRDFQAAIEELEIGQAVHLKSDPEIEDGTAVFTETGKCIGRLTPRHAVSKALQFGKTVVHASVNSISAPGSKSAHYAPNVRIVTGEAGETFKMPPPAPPREYKLGLVGEINYQKAIECCFEGETVGLLEEPDNRYDKRAVAAIAPGKGIIGYVPRDSWATRLIVDERKIVIGTIASISGPPGRLGVVLDIAINPSGPIPHPVDPPKAVPIAPRAASDPAVALSDMGHIAGKQMITWAFGAVIVLIVLGGLLSGCSSESKKAEQELAMLEKASPSGNELCAAQTKVAEAYLHEGNQKDYEFKRLIAKSTCLLADLDPGYAMRGKDALPVVEGNNVSAAAANAILDQVSDTGESVSD